MAPARSLGSPPRLWWAWYDTQPPACLPACLPACPHYLLYVGCLAANICCPASNGTHSPISLVKAPPSPPPLRVATGLWRRCDRLYLRWQAAAFGGIMYGKGAYERGRRYSVQQDRNDPLMPGAAAEKNRFFLSLVLATPFFWWKKPRSKLSWLDRLGTNMLVLFNRNGKWGFAGGSNA